MRRALLPALLCAAAVVASPSAAGAMLVAPGTQGRALMTWPSDAGLRLAERASDGSFTSPATIALSKTYPAFLSWAPNGAATVLAYDQSRNPTSALQILSRPGAGAAFGMSAPFAAGQPAQVVSTASNARGDSALLLKPIPGNLTLLTAVRGGPLGRPQQIATSSESAAVAVGADGRVLVAYYDFGQPGVHAQFGTVGSPLAPITRLSTAAQFTNVAAALDGRGNATVAFTRFDVRHRERPTELVVRRAGSDGRFGAVRAVARGGRGVGGAGFATFRLAAAGATTALAFDGNDTDGRLGVAIARGGGRFGAAQRPTAPNVRSFAKQPFNPSVAVDRAGDVLFAYNTGFSGNAVFVTQRRTGSDRFGSPRVISSLGHGSVPVPALLSDRTALVAWDDGLGDARYTTRLAGRRPDPSPPRVSVELRRDTEAGLRASNAVGVRVRCSEACLLTGRATLRTTTGRSIEGAGTTVLRAGATMIKRFAFDVAKRAGRARDGSILRVTLAAENASGASRETAKQITLRPR